MYIRKTGMPNARSKWKDRCIYGVVAIFGWWCRRLPKSWAIQLGCGIGTSILLSRQKNGGRLPHIICGSPSVTTSRQHSAQKSARRVSSTSAIPACEFLRFPKRNAQNIWNDITVEGQENLHTALEGGKGAIVCLAHFGNWELLSLVYGALIPDRAKAIAFPLKNQLLNAYISRHRERMSLELIPRKQAVRETLRALKNNQAVGFFADQNAGTEGVFVEFLGKPAFRSSRPRCTCTQNRSIPLLFSHRHPPTR